MYNDDNVIEFELTDELKRAIGWIQNRLDKLSHVSDDVKYEWGTSQESQRRDASTKAAEKSRLLKLLWAVSISPFAVSQLIDSMSKDRTSASSRLFDYSGFRWIQQAAEMEPSQHPTVPITRAWIQNQGPLITFCELNYTDGEWQTLKRSCKPESPVLVHLKKLTPEWAALDAVILKPQDDSMLNPSFLPEERKLYTPTKQEIGSRTLPLEYEY